MKASSYMALLATPVVLARSVPVKRASAGQNVVYWGQNDSEKSLRSYCASGQGIDVIVLAFLSTVGNGHAPSGSFGNECNVDSNGGGNCPTLKSDINYCRSQGKKIVLSVGGAGAKYDLSSKGDADGVAWSLWNSWAAPNAVDSAAPRPIGDSYVDGWDFDIEDNPNNSGDLLGEVVTKLRSHFSSDTSHSYVITGAPQCPLPEANMGKAISSATFDYLFIQFYNNDYCSAYQTINNDGGAFNYDDWVNFTKGTASANAKLFIGLPASKEASTGDSSGSKYYIPSSKLPGLVNTYKSHTRFGGVMLWDAGNSDIVNVNGCNYAQHVKHVLDTGAAC